MYNTISRLSLALTSIAVITTLYGCSATLPSHDGSLHSVYGIDGTAPQEAILLAEAEPQPAASLETYEPTVQTISGTGVIASNPITSIIVEEQVPEEPELAATNTPMEHTQTEPVSALPKDHEHKLGAGETLFSVAGDLTGSSNNWKAIADYNSIADPGAITVGQSIVIPGALLTRGANDKELSSAFEALKTIKTEQHEGPQPNIVVSANGTQEIEFAALETTVIEPMAAPRQSVNNTLAVDDSNTGFSDSVRTQSEGSLKKSIANFASIIKTNFTLPATIATATSSANRSKIAIAPVDTRDSMTTDTTINTAMLNPELPSELGQPTAMQLISVEPSNTVVEPQDTQPEETIATPALSKQVDQWIQVDGNFTPKAIYKGAGYTTGLLMRVSPGTKFKLTSKTDDWYEIETNKGVGFIFYRDVLPSQ